MDMIAVGVVDVDLDDVEVRHHADAVGRAAALQQRQEIGQPLGGEGEVLEAQFPRRHRLSRHLHQVHVRLIAAVEPGPAEAEGRPWSLGHAQHLGVEGPHGRQVGGAQIHVVELGEAHGRSFPLRSWGAG